MLKRVALLGAIVALTMIVKPSGSIAQEWGGWDGCCGAPRITVTVTGFPGPVPFRRPCCERRFFPPPRVACCEHRFIPPRPIGFCCERRFFPPVRPVAFCCERRFFPEPFARPPYFYGDQFEPYAYNWNGGYGGGGFDGGGFDGDGGW